MTPDDVTLRLATAADLPALLVVEHDSDQTFRGTDLDSVADNPPTPSELLAPLLDEGAFWVAEAGDGPVGFLAAGTRDGQLIIFQLSVIRAAQRRGIGARLIEAVIAHGRATGAPELLLTTFRDVPWNGPWYARFGFVEIPAPERSPAVQRMLAHEEDMGLDPTRRCAMRLALQDGLLPLSPRP